MTTVIRTSVLKLLHNWIPATDELEIMRIGSKAAECKVLSRKCPRVPEKTAKHLGRNTRVTDQGSKHSLPKRKLVVQFELTRSALYCPAK